jgi:hypothetical protein
MADHQAMVECWMTRACLHGCPVYFLHTYLQILFPSNIQLLSVVSTDQSSGSTPYTTGECLWQIYNNSTNSIEPIGAWIDDCIRSSQRATRHEVTYIPSVGNAIITIAGLCYWKSGQRFLRQRRRGHSSCPLPIQTQLMSTEGSFLEELPATVRGDERSLAAAKSVPRLDIA